MSELTERQAALNALLGRFAADNPTAPALTSTDPAEIGEHLVRNAAPGTSQRWLADLMATIAPPKSRLTPGVLALAAAGIITGLALIWGIFFTPGFLQSLADPAHARGLITFLFAFATIAVVVISVIATFWVKIDEVEKRATLSKEVLTILIGIMGTILGFYFGADSATPPPAPPENIAPNQ
jgi:hypothetical protein